ncbi:hypothetical protein AKG34_21365 [Peribacillus butanolivorans]|uniref:hypothetical protein n=1 Tax=Peribacillus butanolivorans TaxID=421767 RepID=UPI0006A74CB5|nr:hypothetical protein [Peribacillus butanolivorans]KON67371.1 hypothetical protein AKG34_21365 [Peribacillus butanolivorans]
MATNVKILRYISYNGTDKPIKKAKEHIKYIEANREKHRNNPDLFNEKEDKVNRKEFFKRLDEQTPNGVVLHKMVLTMSEDEQKRLKIDLRELARDTMAAFETKIGRRLCWGAGLHDDPNHPHIHIFLLGRDEDGKQVGIYPLQVKQLKQIAEQEKVRQAERNLSRREYREILKEIDKERDSSRYIDNQRTQSHQPSSGMDFSKDMLNTVEQLLKQSQREIDRVQRKAWKDAEREEEQKRDKGRGNQR